MVHANNCNHLRVEHCVNGVLVYFDAGGVGMTKSLVDDAGRKPTYPRVVWWGCVKRSPDRSFAW